MDNQPQVGQLDGDDLQLDVTVVEPDPFDAGIEVVGGRVAGVGGGFDHVQPNRPHLRLVRQRRCSQDAGEADGARPDCGRVQACR